MRETRRNFMVGLFMVFGLAALGYLLVLFGEAPSWLGGAEWVLKINLREISGIEEGTPIYLNGIKVGRVTELNFVNLSAPEQGIEVVGQIRKEFSVPTGSVAQCIGPAFGLGRGRIEIVAGGAGTPIPSGGVIGGVTVNPLDKILPETLVTSVEGTIVKVGTFAESLTPVAEDLHELLKKSPIPDRDDEAAQATFVANLYSLIQRFDRTLASLDAVIGDPQLKSGLLDAVANIRTMSVDGKAAMQDIRDLSANAKIDASRLADRMEVSLANFDAQVLRLSDSAVPLLNEGARMAADLRTISGHLLAGRGTLGRLLMDERLYEVVLLTFERTREAVDSLRHLFERFEKSGRIGLSVGGGIPVDQKLPK